MEVQEPRLEAETTNWEAGISSGNLTTASNSHPLLHPTPLFLKELYTNPSVLFICKIMPIDFTSNSQPLIKKKGAKLKYSSLKTSIYLG